MTIKQIAELSTRFEMIAYCQWMLILVIL